VKAGGFSASSSLYNGPLSIHGPGVKTTSNNRKPILTINTTYVYLQIINRAIYSRIDRGDLVKGKLIA
jgi:hypothetical protein